MEDLDKNAIQEPSELNLREQIDQYLRYWPWFVISVVVAISISFLYLRYATPIYKTVASILIKDEKNSALSELAAFQDLGLTGSLNQAGFENEIQILKSKSLTERVVRELNLNIRYIAEGNILDSELVGKSPITVTILTSGDSLKEPLVPFYVLPISETNFQLWEEEGSERKEYFFGDKISLSVGDISVSPNLQSSYYKENSQSVPIKVLINSISSTVAAYRQNVQVEKLTDQSSVIQLSLNSPNTRKSELVLNEFIRQYNQDAMDDRNMVSRNTANFIKGRLEIIAGELDSVETGKVEFKESNKLTDIATEGQLFLENESEFTKRVLETETKLELVNTVINYIKDGNESNLLPANLGIETEGTVSAITAYNQKVLERNRLLGSSTEKNPVVSNLNEQIEGLKSAVLAGLNNAKVSLEIQRNDLNRQEAIIGSKISSIPSKEKLFRGINRQQEIKETLYLYLLQKREENAISLAVTTPKAKVVDYAYSSMIPVSPKKNIIFLAALILGLLAPFSVIYLRNLLDNKLRTKEYIERRANDTPVIGEIPKLDTKEPGLVQKNDRSIYAESFRIMRTNLQYLFAGKPKYEGQGKTVFVTSTIKGEGKTQVSFNLALTLAATGSKVVLVGADIRNPQLHRYVPNAPSTNGIVEYLVHKDSTLKEYIQDSDLNENLSLLYSGTIPPNPAELWMQDRTSEMFAELRENFDYIIVDTAPCMLVTDTFLISEHADATLYVLRAGYTEKRLLGFPLDNIQTKKLKNVAFVLNSVRLENLGYGNKYGYHYIEDQTFWQKMRASF